jgi:transposase
VPGGCGIDWAEDHPDVALVDEAGQVVASRRIGDDPEGARRLLELLAEAGDAPGAPVPVAIETPRGLLVACLRATGRPVYAINPLAVARYRDRHRVTRAKSDHADAVCLANILRTDRAAHRPLPADSEQVQALAVLARAQQDAVWSRQQLTNRLRSLLREYYPAFLEAFEQVRPGGLTSPDARAVLAVAPTPGRAAALTRGRLRAALARGGASATSTRSSPGSRPSSAARGCTNCPWSKRHSAARRWRSCSNWTPPAEPPPISPRRRPCSSASTPTPPSWPASPAWATSPGRGCWPSSATTPPASPTPAA